MLQRPDQFWADLVDEVGLPTWTKEGKNADADTCRFTDSAKWSNHLWQEDKRARSLPPTRPSPSRPMMTESRFLAWELAILLQPYGP